MSEHDTLRRFIFENLPVQGRHAHLDASWRAVLDRQDYPETVRVLLGEAFAAATLLSATLKFDGTLTLQIRGKGPVHLLVVQCTSGLNLRGLARWRGATQGLGFRQLLDDAQLAITIEQTRKIERYQGIVPLEGDSLAASLESYFARSEQLDTRLWLSTHHDCAAGFLLQAMPEREHAADAWRRVTVLADTLKPEELANLSAQELLHRLYHEDDVRLFGGVPLAFRCQCSRERIEATLRGLGREEVTALLQEQGKVAADCEFCGRHYEFDAVDVEALFTSPVRAPGPERHH